MSDGADVTLVVATKDRAASTVETLSQLRLADFGDVLLVDDSDGEALRRWARTEPVTWLRGPGRNLQAARNVALQRCSTPIISYVDDDVLLPTDFARRVARVFDAHPEAVVVGGPTLSTNVEDARNRCYGPKMAINPYTGTVHDDSYRWIPDEPQHVGLLKGANMSFRTDALAEIGGFDTRYGGPAQREETDVMARICELGDVLYHPELGCYHKQRGSDRQAGGGGFDSSFIEWRFKNHGYFVAKNFGSVAWLLGLLSIATRICGNPESLVQLVYRRVALGQTFSVANCLRAYVEGYFRWHDHGDGAAWVDADRDG